MRVWLKLIALVLVIVLLVLVGLRITYGIAALLGASGTEVSAPDPMFAEEPEPLPTRPPELDEEQPQPEHPTLDDYVPQDEAPVDVTADELIRRAQASAQGED